KNVSSYFEDCLFTSNGNHGLHLVNQRSVTLHNVLCTGNTQQGLRLEGTTNNKIDSATIFGGEFDSNGGFRLYIKNYLFVSLIAPWVSSGRTLAQSGCYITGCNHVSINGGKFYWCGADGLNIDNCNEVSV